ncbi:MAG TPA: FHA domain-containing protein [Thermosynechococcus sp. M3746_W2019_013]|uniref:FHA domain-containing protein n=1 Tax=Thermosynechococcus sp. M3746_W2019_013 TaxID=2747806 RepID=UPI0019E39A59|nr:FHA domain-containing protein [Thermosynechococcus sp. M3746_W2019_013]HIK23339.1 FHA domain-containing protein [Thermosynechococcus sp. M3746_W2019_013]
MPTPSYPKASLIVRERGLPKQAVILSPDRQWTSGPQLDCCIHLTDTYVSRLHAEINAFLFRGQPLSFISDSHSRNGTFLNGLPLQHRTLLHHEEVIGVGTTYPDIYLSRHLRKSPSMSARN